MDIELLKRRKKELNITFDELSEVSGIPKKTLSNIFRGLTPNPRIDTVQAIERALGIAEEPTTAITANESFIQEYGSLFEDNVFRRYTRVFYLLNGEQRLYMLGYVIGVAERYGIKAEEVM